MLILASTLQCFRFVLVSFGYSETFVSEILVVPEHVLQCGDSCRVCGNEQKTTDISKHSGQFVKAFISIFCWHSCLTSSSLPD